MSERQARNSGGGLGASGWVFGCRIASVAFSFVIAALLSRRLPHEDVGRYFIAMSLAGFLALVAQFGLPGIAVREVSRSLASPSERGRANALSWSLLRACCLAAVILLISAVAGFGAISVSLGRPVAEDMPTALLVALIAAELALQTVIGEILRGFQRIITASWSATLLTNLIACALLMSAAAVGWRLTVIDALSASAIAGALNLGIGLKLMPPRTHGSMDSALPWLARGRPFLFNGLGTFLFFQADLWVAAAVLPLSDVALYGVASRVAQPLAFPIEAIEAPLPPLIVRFLEAGRLSDLERILRRAARIQSLVIGIVVVGLVAFAGSIISIGFGPDYFAAGKLVAILSIGWLARASMGAYGHTLMMTADARKMASLTVLCSLLCLPAEWVTGKFWGAEGIAASAALMLGAFSVAGARVAKVALAINCSAFSKITHTFTSHMKNGNGT